MILQHPGCITPQSLATAETNAESIPCNHSKPVVNVAAAINERTLMADSREATKTPIHLIDSRLIIIARSTHHLCKVTCAHGIPNLQPKKPGPTTKLISKQRKRNAQKPTCCDN
jgi:hypothetical protein